MTVVFLFEWCSASFVLLFLGFAFSFFRQIIIMWKQRKRREKIIGLWGNREKRDLEDGSECWQVTFSSPLSVATSKDTSSNCKLFVPFRIFSIRRCARCGAGIGSSDLVMRARDLIFHVNCFSCALCGLPLSAGDTAGIRAGRVFCCEHYETELQL